MNKILQIAWREFIATAMTKTFLLGLLLVPVMMALVAVLVPWMMKQGKTFEFDGEVLLVDPTGRVGPLLQDYLSPTAFAKRRAQLERQMSQLVPPALGRGKETAQGAATAGLDEVLGSVPTIRVRILPSDAPLDELKQQLHTSRVGKGGVFALIEIDAKALGASRDEAPSSPYRFFVAQKVDDRVVDELRSGLRHSLVQARFDELHLDGAAIRALMQVEGVQATRIGEDGEETSQELVSSLLPIVFMMMLFIVVMTSGQMLLTSTIEEKSSRVIELLLAAVSPTQLMAGKILGQGAVAALMLSVYFGLGILGLASLAAIGLLKPFMLLCFAIYFVIAFVTFAALMSAIGAAVNELREAQSLMTPVMLVTVLPMMLIGPISRDPNGTMATVLSFIPPVSPMIMVLRMASNAPPPGWQVALSILLGVLGAVAAVWIAGKVFRIGVLMYGKPPSLLTLWRWVRMS